MKAVLSYTEFFIILVRHCIHKCFFGHCLVKSSIKNRNLRNFRTENSCAGLNALKVCKVVKRCKRSKLSDFVDYRVIYKHRLVKVRTALHNSVTYSGNLGQIADCTVFGIYECIFNSLKSLSVIKHLCFAVDFFAVGCFKTNESTVLTDSFTVTLCENCLVVSINKLVLERGTACVDYENFHYNRPLW